VQEETDPQRRVALAQHLRHEHELVIVHPHQVPVGGGLEHGVGEAAVDVAVVVPPPRVVVAHVAGQVVKQRPDAGVAEPLVEAGHLVGGEEDGDVAEFARDARFQLALAVGLVHARAGPADPLELVPVARHPFQRRYQTAGGFLYLLALDGDGQAVGDIDDGAAHSFGCSGIR
jgi:hypothetical protein